MSYAPLSQGARNARLASLPRCGYEWREKPTGNEHKCVRYLDHAGRDHVCICGARTQKGKKR